MDTKQMQKLVCGNTHRRQRYFRYHYILWMRNHPCVSFSTFSIENINYYNLYLHHTITTAHLRPSCCQNPYLFPPPIIPSFCHKSCVNNCILDTLNQLCNRNYQLFHPTIIIFMSSPQSYRLNHNLHRCYHVPPIYNTITLL